MAEIIFTEPYIKIEDKFLKKHPNIAGQYGKAIKLLGINPYHPSLRLHKLSGKLSDLYSVSINITYRLSIDFVIQEDKIIPVSIGTHDEVY